MTDALHLGQGLLLGAGLGLFYGFLRYFRPRWLGDLMFVTALLWSWIYLGFGLCGGDLRMAYSACLIAGIFLWEGTFGRLLRPAFSGFWKFVRMRLRLIWLPCKKFLKKAGKIKNYLFLLDLRYGIISISSTNGVRRFGFAKRYLVESCG